MNEMSIVDVASSGKWATSEANGHGWGHESDDLCGALKSVVDRANREHRRLVQVLQVGQMAFVVFTTKDSAAPQSTTLPQNPARP